jgi:hypothetical protein
MAFHSKHTSGFHPYMNPTEAICFVCREGFTGASVRYDGFASAGEGGGHSIYLHTACALEMGQRLISDTWPNRRVD